MFLSYHTCDTALASTPSLKSLLMALQMGLEHKKELPWEWRRSTAGNGVASCPGRKRGNNNNNKEGLAAGYPTVFIARKKSTNEKKQ